MISSVLWPRDRRVARPPHRGACPKVPAECPPCCAPRRAPGVTCALESSVSLLPGNPEVHACSRCCSGGLPASSSLGPPVSWGIFKKAWSPPAGWAGPFQGWAGPERGPALQCYLCSGSLVGNWGRIQRQGGQRPHLPPLDWGALLPEWGRLLPTHPDPGWHR